MTRENKDLLLKDLGARYPYKVHCCIYTMNGKIREKDDILYDIRSLGDNVQTLKLINENPDECFMYYQIKPYLRPMSSMTDEEWNEYNEAAGKDGVMVPLANEIDWLNSHFFDYRGLIEKGLALEAPEEMYKND